MCGSMVDIQSGRLRSGEEKRKKTEQTRMWADAQRDGRPVEYIGGALCSTPQSLADAHYKSAVQ